MKHNAIEMTGLKFNRLTVLEPVESKSKYKKWLCLCDCGVKKIISGRHLRFGTTKSCGCLLMENRSGVTHGLSSLHRHEYHTWTRMNARCSNPNEPSYQDYGARGITVCDEWKNDFAAFYRDMGERPNGHSIERIDNDKGYSPENCRWANSTDQNNNRRFNSNITVNGVTKTKSQWARHLGIRHDTLSARLKTGKTIESMKEYGS